MADSINYRYDRLCMTLDTLRSLQYYDDLIGVCLEFVQDDTVVDREKIHEYVLILRPVIDTYFRSILDELNSASKRLEKKLHN